ncbi:MAG: acyl-CoA dehydrogenase family protein [Deltaproteobacteria bacterium]|nr:acyl-CoA dehydrogenase family protein [Deltaproteobacteria bacterium]
MAIYDVQFTDMERGIRDQFRKYMEHELKPLAEQLESQEILPFPFIKKMVADLGLAPDADWLEETGGVKSGKGSSASADDGDEEMQQVVAFAGNQLTIEMSRVSPGLCSSWGVSVGLCAGNIRKHGTPEQIKKYVPSLLRGDKIGCWCLTEPGAGSDAFGSMRTSAKKAGDSYILNGSKTFITNAPYGEIFLVYAKDADTGAIQAYIVEREWEGVSTGPPFQKMGMKSSPTGEVFFDDVRVPTENLLGLGVEDRDHVRKSLAGERLGIATMSYALAEKAFEIALEYAKTREQGGQPIANYQLVQERLARMYVDISNSRRIVYSKQRTGSVIDACAAKLYVAEVGSRVTQQAIHILGGYGYIAEYEVERLARDAKLLELGGGTTEIQIITIARHLLDENVGAQTFEAHRLGS